MLDQNRRPFTCYKDDIIDLADHIALDLIKHGQAQIWEGGTSSDPGAVTPEIKRERSS
jgi:hypothetical protein